MVKVFSLLTTGKLQSIISISILTSMGLALNTSLLNVRNKPLKRLPTKWCAAVEMNCGEVIGFDMSDVTVLFMSKLRERRKEFLLQGRKSVHGSAPRERSKLRMMSWSTTYQTDDQALNKQFKGSVL